MIMLLDLIVFFIIVALVLFLGTQVIMPSFEGTPLFPILRKSSITDSIHKVEHELEEVAQREHLQELTAEIKARTGKLKDDE